MILEDKLANKTLQIGSCSKQHTSEKNIQYFILLQLQIANLLQLIAEV